MRDGYELADTDLLDLCPLRISGASFPLYCFPGAGGKVDAFEQMVSRMPGDWPVYGIDCGRFFSANESFSIEQLADLSLHLIRKNQQRGPYHFCGYSLGGVVAYEAATRLANEEEDVGLLVLIDAPSPMFMSNLSTTEVSQFRKRHFIDRIRKYCRNMRSGNFSAVVEDALVFVDSRLGAYPWLLARAAFRMVNKPMPPILANKTPKWATALRAYTPKPYTQRLMLFCSQSHKPQYSIDPTLGWGRYARGGVEAYLVPEDHVRMMARSQLFAERLFAGLNGGLVDELEGKPTAQPPGV
jgi:thioesterase domain-containing protein